MATRLKTFRFDEDVLQKFIDISKRRGDLSYHVNEAMRLYGPIQVKTEVKQETKAKVDHSDVDGIIDYLNLRARTKYKHGKASRDCIAPRLKDFSVEDCKLVIDKKCAEWLETDMAKFLRPSTLFQASKFEGYLNQISVVSKEQQREQEVSDWVNGNDIPINGETINHDLF